jgi:hypothetical protein
MAAHALVELRRLLGTAHDKVEAARLRASPPVRFCHTSLGTRNPDTSFVINSTEDLMGDADHYLVTLANLSDGEELTFGSPDDPNT